MQPSTRFTTSAIGLLHILNHFNQEFILSKENEFKIWHSSVNLPTRSLSLYGLASFAKEQGVNAKVIVEEHEYSFDLNILPPHKKEEIGNAKFSSFLHQKKARELGVEIEENPFTMEDVKNFLKEGKLILLRLNKQAFFGYKPEQTYFAIMEYNEKDETFLIIDPKEGSKTISEDKMFEAFDTLKTKCRRDHRMIVLG
jgi:hypothetical protein